MTCMLMHCKRQKPKAYMTCMLMHADKKNKGVHDMRAHALQAKKDKSVHMICVLMHCKRQERQACVQAQYRLQKPLTKSW